MKVGALTSGSSGNCFYVENERKKESVLIDAGISAKQIELKMKSMHLDINNVKGILVTHEHSDHIRGCDVLARRFGIPVFATQKTIQGGFLCSSESLLNPIGNDEHFKLGGMDIEAFPKSHKAADPVGFSMSNLGKRVSVITDAGYASKEVNENIGESDLVFLESNHDPKMLAEGPYPYFLKKWVGGDTGHLSNIQASLCVLEHGSRKLKNVVLSHLSRTNNMPEIALKTFKNIMKERYDFSPSVCASTRDEPTKLFRV